MSYAVRPTVSSISVNSSKSALTSVNLDFCAIFTARLSVAGLISSSVATALMVSFNPWLRSSTSCIIAIDSVIRCDSFVFCSNENIRFAIIILLSSIV